MPPVPNKSTHCLSVPRLAPRRVVPFVPGVKSIGRSWTFLSAPATSSATILYPTGAPKDQWSSNKDVPH